MIDLNIFRDAAKKYKADLSIEMAGSAFSVEIKFGLGGVIACGVGNLYEVRTEPFIKGGKIVSFQDESDLNGLPDLLRKALKVANGELYVDSKGVCGMSPQEIKDNAPDGATHYRAGKYTHDLRYYKFCDFRWNVYLDFTWYRLTHVDRPRQLKPL